jgi:hypothetical protein
MKTARKPQEGQEQPGVHAGGKSRQSRKKADSVNPKDKKRPQDTKLSADFEQPSDALDLKGEIRKLRSAINKLIVIAGDYQDIDQATQVVQSIGLASTRLASLLKTQGKLTAESNDIDDVISRAIADAAVELRRRGQKMESGNGGK